MLTAAFWGAVGGARIRRYRRVAARRRGRRGRGRRGGVPVERAGSLSAATGLRKAGHSERYVIGLWTAVLIASAIAAALGYALLGGASDNLIAGIQAFAAGAILTMLADTMMPEAFDHGGGVVGLVTVLGFSAAFLLSTVGG